MLIKFSTSAVIHLASLPRPLDQVQIVGVHEAAVGIQLISFRPFAQHEAMEGEEEAQEGSWEDTEIQIQKQHQQKKKQKKPAPEMFQ